MAQAMTKDEILGLLSLTQGDLGKVDADNLNLACLRGKSLLVRYAADNLKQQMRGKQGLQACLAALTRFGDAWEMADAVAGAKSFKIILDK